MASIAKERAARIAVTMHHHVGSVAEDYAEQRSAT
jgi:hypothetical protein